MHPAFPSYFFFAGSQSNWKGGGKKQSRKEEEGRPGQQEGRRNSLPKIFSAPLPFFASLGPDVQHRHHFWENGRKYYLDEEEEEEETKS